LPIFPFLLLSPSSQPPCILNIYDSSFYRFHICVIKFCIFFLFEAYLLEYNNLWKKWHLLCVFTTFTLSVLSWWALQLLPFVSYCEQCCNEHGSSYDSFTYWLN
jgi:hypothetical protein